MAKPHGKNLMGREGGGGSIHWYDFVLSKRRLMRAGKWNGPRVKTKPGVRYIIAVAIQGESK